MKVYKTPARQRLRAKARLDFLRAEGGPAYAAWLEKQRISKRESRRKNGRRPYDKKNRVPFKTWLCSNARFRGRKAGMGATIKPSDLVWPTHCPVLGIRLVYPKRSGEGGAPNQKDRPSLDRWDNSKGYVPGNVYVISYRANILKSNATAEELIAVAKYTLHGPASNLPLFNGALPAITVTEIVAE